MEKTIFEKIGKEVLLFVFTVGVILFFATNDAYLNFIKEANSIYLVGSIIVIGTTIGLVVKKFRKN